MSKRTETEVVKVGSGAPSFLLPFAKEDRSLEGVAEYRVVPRLKTIQGMTDAKLKEEFGEGSAIMSPGRRLIAKPRTPFNFVPVFFFTEFVTWRDKDDKSAGSVVARSWDKGGEIAGKARDKLRRFEEYPGSANPKKPFQYRHVEHLNFAGLLYGDSIGESDPMVVGFSRGEFFKGTEFCSAIMMRKVDGIPAPLWSQVWSMRTDTRTRNGNTWWGVDYFDAENPFIREEEVQHMRGLHEDLKALYQKQGLIVDLSEGDDDPIEVPLTATEMATSGM